MNWRYVDWRGVLAALLGLLELWVIYAAKFALFVIAIALGMRLAEHL